MRARPNSMAGEAAPQLKYSWNMYRPARTSTHTRRIDDISDGEGLPNACYATWGPPPLSLRGPLLTLQLT